MGSYAPKPRKVSFLFRRSEGFQHTSGVNALLLSPDQQQLWTASRDSLVKQWDVTSLHQQLVHQNPIYRQQRQPHPLVATYDGHVDWVTDLAQLQGVLVSASADRNLRIWTPPADGTQNSGAAPTLHAQACLSGHSDYVTCLAAAESAGLVASAGLRGDVLLWDVARLQAVLAGTDSSDFAPAKGDSGSASIYSLAMDPSARLLAAGATDCSIRLMDPRTGALVMQLGGHTDNVRALALSSDASLLLSGGSDHTLRLWDLGQQRCVATLAVHTDSVWALAVDRSFSVAYSGGRDGCVYRTSLATRTAELLLRERGPVVALAPCATPSAGGNEVDGVWVATTSSSINLWSVCGEVPPAPAALATTPRGGVAQACSADGSSGAAPRAFVAGPSTATRARMSFAGASTPEPQQEQPVACIPGLPPIQAASVMTDRRHVLTQDAEGSVQLWDVTAGAVVREYGVRDMRDVERELFQPTHSVSPWFTPDTKLGSLAGHMQTPQCFQAEIYAQDLGYTDAPVDLKINFGEHMLKALFRGWAEARLAALRQQQAQLGIQQGQQPQPGSSDAGGTPVSADAGGAGDGASTTRTISSTTSEDAAAAAVELPTFNLSPSIPPLIMITGDAAPRKVAITEFDGSEEEGGPLVPRWVADAVLRGRYPASKDLKTAFQLTPQEGSGLPALLQSRLNAPRVLRVNKVADYVLKKMQEQGISLREEPLFWDAAKQEQWEREQHDLAAAEAQEPVTSEQTNATAAAGSPGIRRLLPVGTMPQGAAQASRAEPALLLTCNGMVVPWDFSLAAVKQWMWKRPEDLVLVYAIRDERTPLRLPAIRMPSS